MVNKTELEKLMKPQIYEIIKQWDSEGIIYETQFEFSRVIPRLDRIKDTLYNILEENGGHEAKTTAIRIMVEGEGCMCCFYDIGMYPGLEIVDKVKHYFETHKTIKTEKI